MSSIVKDELDKIKSFAESTEKRRSKLTLNELNYISDKQLHQKSGGGSGDSPIRLADVRFTSEETHYSGYLDDVLGFGFFETIAVYIPENAEEVELAACGGAYFDDFRYIQSWNAAMDAGVRCITPMILMPNNTDNFEVSIVSGDAEIRTTEDEVQEVPYIYITGDCVISIESTEES